jgi:hypothetical protein
LYWICSVSSAVLAHLRLEGGPSLALLSEPGHHASDELEPDLCILYFQLYIVDTYQGTVVIPLGAEFIGADCAVLADKGDYADPVL